MKVLFDVNIVLDLAIDERSLKYPESVKAYDWLRENKTEIFIAASAIPTIDYLLSIALKKSKEEGKKVPDLKKFLNAVYSIYKIAKTPAYAELNLVDTEDSLIIESAKSYGNDMIVISRDRKIKIRYPNMVLTPAELLQKVKDIKNHNKVSFLPLKQINDAHQPNLDKAVDRVLASGWYLLGNEVKAFEQEYAQYIGTKHCIGVANGLDALRLILRAYIEMGIMQVGDEIIVPANTYITSRGAWYHRSWKGDVQKSGGVATNIGVHFFDMLTWIFGPAVGAETHSNQPDHASGTLQLQNARVQWQLSINSNHLPEAARQQGKTTYRSIKVDGDEIEFSGGFTDLHTASYQSIINGNGYGLQDAPPSVQIVQKLRETLVERVIA